MEARSHCGLALALLAIATDRGRPALRARMREAEQRLQTLWRTSLAERLRRSDLDAETRELLADQLKHLNIQALEQTP